MASLLDRPAPAIVPSYRRHEGGIRPHLCKMAGQIEGGSADMLLIIDDIP
jgi:hypothetical protein